MEVNQEVEAVDKYLSEACSASMPKGSYRRGKKPAFWCSTEISELQAECLRARRRYKINRTRAIPVDGQEDKDISKKVGENLK